MVQVHVPQGVGVRVPSVGTKIKKAGCESNLPFILVPTSEAPARLAGGTRKPCPAGQGGVAERDRAPSVGTKLKRSVAQATGLFHFGGLALQMDALPAQRPLPLPLPLRVARCRCRCCRFPSPFALSACAASVSKGHPCR